MRTTIGGRSLNTTSKTWCRAPVLNRCTDAGAQPITRDAIAAASDVFDSLTERSLGMGGLNSAFRKSAYQMEWPPSRFRGKHRRS